MILPYQSGTVRVSSPFGRRRNPITGAAGDTHRGIDLVGSDKTIVAVADGVVGFAGAVPKSAGGRTWEWGNYIRIDGYDGRRYYYCHLSRIEVGVGVRVSAGTAIGREGSTGASTGSHLHFEVRQGGTSVDPTPYIGIANRACTQETVGKREDFAAKVCEKCGLEGQTRAYLDKYKYADDLWRKLWGGMQG